MFYPIERTSAVVGSFDPCEIFKKIFRCLQKLSITAKFNANEASLLANTVDYTKFYVRLYQAKHGILVELQRVDGDSFVFIKYVRDILASARGEHIDERRAAMSRGSSLNYIPASILSFHVEKFPHEDSNNDSCMMHVEELIKKGRSDSILLGMESLLLLTDQDRSACPIAAARAVLSGNGHSVIKNFINGLLTQNGLCSKNAASSSLHCGCVCGSPVHCPRSTLSPEDDDFNYTSRQCETMHNAALAVLGNSLQTASDAECLRLWPLLQSKEWMGQYGMVDALLSELSHAEDRSHDAYHAARCLNALLHSSSEMKGALIERGLAKTMKDSQKVGCRRHSLLARECDAALAVIADV